MITALHPHAIPAIPANEESLQKRAISKAAWRLLPLVTLAFIFNYIDRTSVGFASLRIL